MKLPPIQEAAMYIAWLREHLARHVPDIGDTKFAYYDFKAARRGNRRIIVPRDAVADDGQLLEFVSHLLREERPWINLSGCGFCSDGRYLVVVEYSSVTGSGGSSIACSGPPYEADGTLRIDAKEEFV